MSDPFKGEVPWPWLLEIANEVYADYLKHPDKYTIDERKETPMLTFSEIEQKAGELAKSVEEHAVSIFHHGSALLAKDVQDYVAKAKADALVVVKNAAPEVQAAVQAAVEEVEKAVLAAIELHLA